MIHVYGFVSLICQIHIHMNADFAFRWSPGCICIWFWCMVLIRIPPQVYAYDFVLWFWSNSYSHEYIWFCLSLINSYMHMVLIRVSCSGVCLKICLVVMIRFILICRLLILLFIALLFWSELNAHIHAYDLAFLFWSKLYNYVCILACLSSFYVYYCPSYAYCFACMPLPHLFYAYCYNLSHIHT